MTLFEHRGRRPQVDPSAYIAPNATISGDARIGADVRILFGAVITAEDGPVHIADRTVVMENALVRGRAAHPATLGANVLIGPHAHINGAHIDNDCFIATGAAIFPGARLGPRTEVRIHAVVHVNTVLAPDALVPIGWIAVGNPASILPPDRHDDIWAVQQHLQFSETVYNTANDTGAAARMTAQTAWFAAHRHDRPLTSAPPG